jgi:hypothetical protein
MMILARRVEDPFCVPVQRPHDADACMHQDIAALGGADQTTDCGLPNVTNLGIATVKQHDLRTS